MLKTCVFVCLTIATLTDSARNEPRQLGPTTTGPESLAAARKYLEGRWTLLEFEVVLTGGETERVYGDGTLTFDRFGNLDIEIRVDEPTARTLGDLGIATTKGVLSTSGRTIVDMQRRTLTYVLPKQLPASLRASPLAQDRPRHWEIEGDVLTLITRGDDLQLASAARWRKLPPP